jgi:protein phosphatase
VQITEDHSFQAEQMRHRSAREDRTGLAARQYITRAVGADREVKPDLFVAELRSGDMILLATDGLTRYVDAKRIGNEIQLRDSAQEKCRSLIAMAYEQGAEDNVTCLLIRVR